MRKRCDVTSNKDKYHDPSSVHNVHHGISIILSIGGETFKAIEEDHSGTSAAEKQDSDMMTLYTLQRDSLKE